VLVGYRLFLKSLYTDLDHPIPSHKRIALYANENANSVRKDIDMRSVSEARQLSVSIELSTELAYAFLAEPSNFPQWASGLGALHESNGQWIAETPDGPMRLRFSEKNAFGVLDHWVSPPAGAEIYIPMRVVANGAGSELIFTLFRQPAMTQEKFEADAAWVARDLQTAKKLLEAR
jgi:hypothetical protein